MPRPSYKKQDMGSNEKCIFAFLAIPNKISGEATCNTNKDQEHKPSIQGGFQAFNSAGVYFHPPGGVVYESAYF